MQFLNKISIAKKLRFFLLIGLIAFLLFGILLFTYLYQEVYTGGKSQMEDAIRFANAELLSTMRTQHMLVTQLVSDDTLNSFISTSYSSITPAFGMAQTKLDANFDRIKQYLPKSKIFVYNDNQTVHSSNEFIISLKEALSYNWIDRDVMKNNRRSFWAVDYTGGISYLICYRPAFNNYAPYELKMVVAIAVRISELEALVSSNDDTTVILATEEGLPIFVANSRISSENAADIIKRQQDRQSEIVSIGKTSYLLYRSLYTNAEMNIEGWQIILLKPFGALMGGFIGLGLVWGFITVLVFSALFILTRMVIKNIAYRTGMVLTQIDRIASENYTPFDGITGNDEFSSISDKLNLLSKRLSFLIEEVYKYTIELNEVQIEKQSISLKHKEAEIIALQNQINPHYFFNTLEAIRMNLLLSGDEKNSEMIQFFAEGLRTYSKSPYSLVSIGEELKFLEKYIKLQNYRLNGQVAYEFSAGDDMLGYQIPHFLLQPLLENAVIHGFRTKFEKCFIGIYITEREDKLYLCVRDNGAGMSEARLATLRKSLDSRQVDQSVPGFIGLTNVNERIKLLYGEECGLRVESGPNCGTNVEVCLKKALKG